MLPGQYKWSEFVVTPDEVSLVCCHGVQHPVHVVQVPVLPLPVHLVLGHRHLRPVEHARLVHVVPSVGVKCGTYHKFIL